MADSEIGEGNFKQVDCGQHNEPVSFGGTTLPLQLVESATALGTSLLHGGFQEHTSLFATSSYAVAAGIEIRERDLRRNVALFNSRPKQRHSHLNIALAVIPLQNGFRLVKFFLTGATVLRLGQVLDLLNRGSLLRRRLRWHVAKLGGRRCGLR